MENNRFITLTNAELKRLHLLLTITGYTEEYYDRVFKMIESIHKTMFNPIVYIPNESNVNVVNPGWKF